MVASIMNLEGSNLVIIALVIFVLFGAKQIPKWARSLRETRDELRKTFEDEEPK